MQIRRVLLLFALVLGLSALVASIAPAPEEDNKEAQAPGTTPTAAPPPTDLSPPITLEAQPRGTRPATRRVRLGSSFSLDVRVRRPGEVVLEGLGLRQPADPLTPASFDLLASPAGRHEVDFAPVTGGRRLIGWLEFVEPATVTQRRRDR